MGEFEDEVRIGNALQKIKGTLEAILATTAKLLVRQQDITAASILANANTSIRYLREDRNITLDF
jgi:hypothetical protein